ncbi:MAG: CPBP family intramembrane metalloprotease [Eubacteriales bacterium]|nr:CPBP family intramembrane metalloprotease [Eubacteriales bacterium]MDY3332611.1 CPBP family intramembrane glutamic endopeptidase [Gallibacter sp.]
MFWKQVLYTALFFVGSFILAAIIENIFVDINSGMIVLGVNNLLELLLFSLSTIIFPAIVEETFFRKNLICFANKKILVTTTLSSMLLYSLEHALTISGILLCMIWALPLSLSYIKTKNIYVPMTAHFICNFIMNGFSVIIALQSGII